MTRQVPTRRVPLPPAERTGRRLLDARRWLDEMVDAGGPNAGAVRITDNGQLMARLERVLGAARHEVFSLLSGQPPQSVFDAARSSDLALSASGIRLRVVYPRAFAAVDYVRAYTEELTRAGALVRFADRVPHRMLVVDGVHVVVPIDVADEGRGALFITEPAIGRGLHLLAQNMFARGVPLAEVSGPVEAPSAVELRVLTLMNTGVTDEVAARELGISDRTFRRYVPNPGPATR